MTPFLEMYKNSVLFVFSVDVFHDNESTRDIVPFGNLFLDTLNTASPVSPTFPLNKGGAAKRRGLFGVDYAST